MSSTTSSVIVMLTLMIGVIWLALSSLTGMFIAVFAVGIFLVLIEVVL